MSKVNSHYMWVWIDSCQGIALALLINVHQFYWVCVYSSVEVSVARSYHSFPNCKRGMRNALFVRPRAPAGTLSPGRCCLPRCTSVDVLARWTVQTVFYQSIARVTNAKRLPANSTTRGKQRFTSYCVPLLRALVRRSPRVLAFEWVPLVRVRNGCARATPRFPLYYVFFSGDRGVCAR